VFIYTGNYRLIFPGVMRRIAVAMCPSAACLSVYLAFAIVRYRVQTAKDIFHRMMVQLS